jgi:intracellular sulfur oxidation DsrE/DsrF family protein
MPKSVVPGQPGARDPPRCYAPDMSRAHAQHPGGPATPPRRPGILAARWLLAGVLAISAPSGGDPDLPPEFYPEHHQVDALLESEPPPHGIMLLIRNEREDALVELLPRARYYTDYLQERLPGVHIAIISYGPELVALSHARRTDYPGLQEEAVALGARDNVDVHLCGAFAAEASLDTTDFPAGLDVVPSSTALYQDYEALGYEAVVLQMAW